MTRYEPVHWLNPKTICLEGRTYRLHERIGHDGERYRATIGGGQDSYVLHVFRDAAQLADKFGILKRLAARNVNLPTFIEAIPSEKDMYVVTSWVPGRPLQEYLDEAQAQHQRRMRVFSAVLLFCGLGFGLEHLNRHQNVVHGDLHPENVIVQPKPNTLVVIDFQNAWFLNRGMLRSVSNGNHRHYAAPEIQMCARAKSVKAAVVDFRADQFSLAIMFYEMLTSKVPYQGVGGLAGVPGFRELYARPPEPPSKKCLDRDRLSNRAWEIIDRFVLKGIALDRNQRFVNSSDWLSGLKQLKEAATPPSHGDNGNQILRPF